MKKLILKLSFFLILIIFLVSGLAFLADYTLRELNDKLLKINDDKQTIFAGHSHIECAIDDKIIQGSINFAQSGEACLYFYSKLKALLVHNPQIETIFIGFAFSHVLKETEERWLFTDEFIVEKIKTYNYLFEPPEKSRILKNNSKAYVSEIMRSVLTNLNVLVSTFSTVQVVEG